MKGNIFISVPASDIANELPTSITRYDWVEHTYNGEGEVESTTNNHPTWEQFGIRNSGLFGSPVTVADVVVYEMEASWLDSEVSALIALGDGQPAPNYTVYTNAEVRQFIADNTAEL
tara:strand:+ start:507 stop:857 length:351 start_codon:yes stop_codon:yes gene_type:complete